MFFNSITKSWHNMPSMEYARYLPVLGVTEDHVIPYKCSLAFCQIFSFPLSPNAPNKHSTCTCT